MRKNILLWVILFFIAFIGISVLRKPGFYPPSQNTMAVRLWMNAKSFRFGGIPLPTKQWGEDTPTVRSRELHKFSVSPEKIVSDYLRSQDIYDPEEKIKDRIFVSDSSIYLGAGYLYAGGANPADYNFQHPPLVKYLYGFSLKAFGNPYPVSAVFAFLLIFLTFVVAYKLTDKKSAAALAVLFVILDPLTAESVYNVYLDLGQTVFALAFVYSFLFKPKNFILQGILFGLLLSSKFWSTSLFLLLGLLIYKIFFLKDFNFKKFAASFGISALVYAASYAIFFIKGGGLVDFILLQIKMLKFMLDHNSGAVLGGQFLLFLTGFYKSWWGSGGIMKSDIWTPLWPASFAALLPGIINKKTRKIFVVPAILVFMFFLSSVSGVPFSRYLIFITPYLYICLGAFLVHLAEKFLKQ